MEFRDIIAAGILHEISDEAKRKLKKAGKIGAGAAALGGAGYLAYKHLRGEGADTTGPELQKGVPPKTSGPELQKGVPPKTSGPELQKGVPPKTTGPELQRGGGPKTTGPELQRGGGRTPTKRWV